MTSLLTFTPEGLVAWLTGLGIENRLLRPGVPMPTVPLAAQAIGIDEQQILKTLLFRDRAGSLVRVIASGPSRIDLDRLAQLGRSIVQNLPGRKSFSKRPDGRQGA